MANKTIFNSFVGMFTPKTDTFNEVGGRAYEFTPKHALAQYAVTGSFNATFYAQAEDQFAKVIELCEKTEPEFVAKLAVFARERGFMKDMPAFLAAMLSVKDKTLLEKIFPRVINNGKMLRNFVQIMRSGAVGRKSLGSLPKRLVREWFETREPENIFKQSVGQAPSFADILKMIHPKPTTDAHEALYGYLIGKEIRGENLPEIVKVFENFKQNSDAEVPQIPFQMLTALPLETKHWKEIARNAGWTMTRMNLNTFQRQGVFADAEMVKIIADRLRDAEAIRHSKVFPYQLLIAYKMAEANEEIPREIVEALQDAMEIAVENVPRIDGKVFIFPDISGSMQSPVTGFRNGSTSAVRCIDVAALIAASILRKNPAAEVIPFESDIAKVSLNPRDSIMTNAQKLANLPFGGTNCSAPLRHLNRIKAKGDVLIYVSDNESWIDTPHYGRFGGSGTETMKEWNAFQSRNAGAKLVCIDIQPYGSTQAQERLDILNIGGFSDQVFEIIDLFAKNKLSAEYWVGEIEKVDV